MSDSASIGEDDASQTGNAGLSRRVVALLVTSGLVNNIFTRSLSAAKYHHSHLKYPQDQIPGLTVMSPDFA